MSSSLGLPSKKIQWYRSLDAKIRHAEKVAEKEARQAGVKQKKKQEPAQPENPPSE